jgi:alpha-tubulin suppressor-like RCC1 family protein
VIGLTSGVTSVAAGEIHSLAVRSGDVYAWGDNHFGELGDGTTTQENTPELIDPTDLHNIVAIAAAAYSSYALSSDGSLWVWGHDTDGELGLGNTIQFLTPQHLLPPSGYVYTSIDADSFGEHVVTTLAPVPEPASVSLIALAAGALWWRRRAA